MHYTFINFPQDSSCKRHYLIHQLPRLKTIKFYQKASPKYDKYFAQNDQWLNNCLSQVSMGTHGNTQTHFLLSKRSGAGSYLTRGSLFFYPVCHYCYCSFICLRLLFLTLKKVWSGLGSIQMTPTPKLTHSFAVCCLKIAALKQR